jgi:hypothetical protein
MNGVFSINCNTLIWHSKPEIKAYSACKGSLHIKEGETDQERIAFDSSVTRL